MMKIFFLVCFQIFITSIRGCTISLNNDLAHPQPLLLTLSASYGTQAFHLPTSRDEIWLSNGDLIQTACPGSNLSINGKCILTNVENATCYNNRFLINEKIVAFRDISCKDMPEHVARFTNKTCLDKYQEIEIGFMVNSRFLRIMEICFNGTNDNTLYSKFVLTKTISGFQFGFPRPSWIQGDFFRSISVNSLYTRNVQRRTINNLLGLDSDSFKYVAEVGDLFLARGHLTARADFLFGSQQWATFYFVNAAPHWQTFNGGNWMLLESDIRRFSSRIRKDLVIYTGTYGISTLPHATTGQDIELFLDVFGTYTRRIPVPQLYWKVLYEPITKSGTVFLGVNNPYLESVAKHVICEDVCDEIQWLTWQKDNITAGYCYCCTVDDFRKNVDTLPEFEVVSLLK